MFSNAFLICLHTLLTILCVLNVYFSKKGVRLLWSACAVCLAFCTVSDLYNWYQLMIGI